MAKRPPSRRHREPAGSGPPHPDRGRPPVRRYKVLLHRPADKGLMFVARAVMELTHFGEAEAEYRMWDAHHNGRTVIVVTHFERAELYVEQFGERGLLTSIEPV